LLVRRAAAIAVLALTLPAAAAPRLGAPPAAQTTTAATPLSRVLARTFRHYGGVNAILAVGSVRLRGTVADRATAPEHRPHLERFLLAPDRYRAATSIGGVEREILVLDGSRAFRDGAEVTGLARADLIRLEAARTFLPGALARERASLVDRGEARVGGRRVYLVELPLHEQASLTAEIDPSSGTILRARTRVATWQAVTTFSRFRRVAGILFPFAEEMEASDGKRTLLLDQVEVLPPPVLPASPR
jgi:hypothetical protein